MTLVVTPTLDDAYQTLGDFLETVLPGGVVVIQTPQNRVSMPPAVPGFVGMTARIDGRIMTNLDQFDPNAVAPNAVDILQAVRLAIQLDCYGAASNDWAIMFSTVLRDEYGCTALSPVLSPLYTEDPRFAVLVDGEEEYEQRWIVDALLEYHPITSTPMQFANAAAVTIVEIDARFPP